MAQYGCKVRVGRPGRGVLEGVKLDFQGRDLLQVLLLPGDTTALSTLRLVTDPFNNYNKYRSKRKTRECDRSSCLSSDQNTRSFPWSARPVAGNTLYLDPCGSAPGQGSEHFRTTISLQLDHPGNLVPIHSSMDEDKHSTLFISSYHP